MYILTTCWFNASGWDDAAIFDSHTGITKITIKLSNCAWKALFCSKDSLDGSIVTYFYTESLLLEKSVLQALIKPGTDIASSGILFFSFSTLPGFYEKFKNLYWDIEIMVAMLGLQNWVSFDIYVKLLYSALNSIWHLSLNVLWQHISTIWAGHVRVWFLKKNESTLHWYSW